MTTNSDDQLVDNPVEKNRTAPGEYHPGWRQREFNGWIDEQMSWKETCYIGDWSFLSALRLTGDESLDLLADISVNTFDNFSIGQGKHVIQCNEDGYVISEGVLRKVEEEEFVLHGVPGYWTKYNMEKWNYDASGEFQETFNFQVQGPNSIHVLEELADESLRDIDFIHFDSINIHDRDIVAIRMGMAGEIGFELQGPAEYADEVWDAVVEAGQEYGIEQLGARTVMLNHLEACFPTRGRAYVPAIYGPEMKEYNEWLSSRLEQGTRGILSYPIEGSFEGDDITDWYRTPIELGWERNVDLDHDFIGRDALAEEKADPDRTLVTLVWDDQDVIDVYTSLFGDGEPYKFMDMPTQQQWAMQADSVLNNTGEEIGVSTSRGYSYYFREMLSLCTIDPDFSEPGTEVTVIWGDPGQPQKEIGATVAPAPYKKDRRFVDLTTLQQA